MLVSSPPQNQKPNVNKLHSHETYTDGRRTQFDGFKGVFDLE